MRSMRFAISIPQLYADGEFDPAAFRAYFAPVEELGFESAGEVAGDSLTFTTGDGNIFRIGAGGPAHR